jgi:hypothetical protein
MCELQIGISNATENFRRGGETVFRVRGGGGEEGVGVDESFSVSISIASSLTISGASSFCFFLVWSSTEEIVSV